jgi:hypothetical protein
MLWIFLKRLYAKRAAKRNHLALDFDVAEAAALLD